MNRLMNGASQGTMPNERDDGNTTTIRIFSKEVGEKEEITLNNKAKLSYEGRKHILPMVLHHHIADKRLM